MHKNKSDFLRVQDQLKNEVAIINREKDGLEKQLRQTLAENDCLVEELEGLRND